ncbi:TetR/AcrR family transcriptional regulator [Ktedonosporobacter rubrisoli]|uniref:TetR/AcrR family transcriptional regulator n=1 Tax=Ktedonosporobacter rubrisoli TaxID=2509675 RepID=A0A4P6JI87_KTERU|nr:TetR/AcrR family transcriptional regulator [Ktedonosporobacter rubrisoli]QBD74622.1 TetR/AcrR family transcriptional regulator [Ktedonosporobacter rubrisoli]
MSSKRDQIILATRDLVFEQGLQDVAMSQIAQRAQVGMGTIYNYFPSKEDLVFCLFSEIKAAMSLHVLDGYDATQPVVDRVLYLLGGMVRYGIGHPREFLLMNQLALVPFIHERAKGDVPALVSAFKQVLIDATQQHLLKAMAPGVILALLSGAMNALVEAHMRQQIHLDQATIEQAMSACWDAIKR